MKLKTYAVVLALLGIGYGLCLILLPVKFLGAYGINLDGIGVILAQFFGIALCALAIINWTIRNVTPADRIWRGFLVAALFFNGISAAFNIKAIEDGLVNSLGWSTVVLQIILALGACLFLFGKKEVKRA